MRSVGLNEAPCGLSADEAEVTALRAVADGCSEQTLTYEPTQIHGIAAHGNKGRIMTIAGRTRGRIATVTVALTTVAGLLLATAALASAEVVRPRHQRHPATVRDAFVLLWQGLRRNWSAAALMGSPSQAGRDLWTHAIPARRQHADGFPVLSEELRGLLDATAAQGRNELLQGQPEQKPGEGVSWPLCRVRALLTAPAR